MSKNLQIQSLEFDEIKDNLIQFLKGQDKFKDFNFYGSGFDVILDLLAYNTHYAGFYAHMLANESFIDSAYLKSSLTSKAKLVNYIPRSTNSAIAEVVVSVNGLTEDPTGKSILMKRGEIAIASKGNSQASDGRKFIILDDLYIYNKSLVTGEYDYSSDTIDIYEGTFLADKYQRDTSLTNQRFIIRNKDVDYRTIRIKVYPNETLIGTDNFLSYKLANDFMNIDGESNVFFLSVNEDDYYEVFFGNDVYGRAVQHGNVVEISYVEATGEIGNNATNFAFSGDLDNSLVGTDVEAVFETISASDGGRDAETLEELRFNIPHHYRRQNRLVSIEDYKTILISEYGNISSLAVWGGEDNYPKSYGKVYISIKPQFGDVLSSKAKKKIINDILKKYNVATIEPIMVDPDFLYVNLTTTTRFNPDNTDRTAGEIITLISETVDEYNTGKVSRFDGYYSNTRLNNSILAKDDGIITTYNDIELEKRFVPSLNTVQSYYVDFNNPIKPSTFKSDEFTFRNRKTYTADDGLGNLNVFWYDTIAEAWTKYTDESFGSVDYENGLVRVINVIIEKILTDNDYIKNTAIPVNPDFFPLRNNIVTINSVKTNIVRDYQKK